MVRLIPNARISGRTGRESMRGFKHSRLLTSSMVAMIAAMPVPAIAQVQTFAFDIPAQPLDSALRDFARTSRQQILFDGALVRDKQSTALVGQYGVDVGLAQLL